MGMMASPMTSPMIAYSTVHSGRDQRIHQSSASQAFVRGIHRWPVNSPHKWPVTRKMLPFDDVIMETLEAVLCNIEVPSWPEWSPSNHLHHTSHFIELDEVSYSKKVRYKPDNFLLVLLIFWFYTQEHFFINLILIATNCRKSTSLF